MKWLSSWLGRNSTGWITLTGLIMLIVFMVLILPGQAALAKENADGAGTPDLSFVYTVAELYRMAESYGEQGRSEYVRARFTFDLVWPLVYTFFLVTATSWLFEKTFPEETLWRRANLIPLLAMVLDYLENISTSIVMVRFPAQTFVAATLATVFTPLKWIFVGLSFVLLLLGIFLILWQWLRRM